MQSHENFTKSFPCTDHVRLLLVLICTMLIFVHRFRASPLCPLSPSSPCWALRCRHHGRLAVWRCHTSHHYQLLLATAIAFVYMHRVLLFFDFSKLFFFSSASAPASASSSCASAPAPPPLPRFFLDHPNVRSPLLFPSCVKKGCSAICPKGEWFVSPLATAG
jgi:hypothetical protein